MTGRSHIRAETGKGLDRLVTSATISVSPGTIIKYLHVRLSEDETPDAVDGGLEADTQRKIPGNISEMCLGETLIDWGI